ncbi:MAG: hypothetical protein ACWGHH_07690 [Sulfurovaceae bacterium]
MKEIIRRTPIVLWITVVVVGFSINGLSYEALFLAAILAIPVLAVQFIIFGFVNPMKLFPKQ